MTSIHENFQGLIRESFQGLIICGHLGSNITLFGLPPSVVKDPPANAGDEGSIFQSGRCPGEGNGNLLKYSCLGNPMDRGV